MLTLSHHIESVPVATAPPKLTKSQLERLKTAAAELARLDALLDEVSGLRAVFAEAGAKFAAGEIDVLTASHLLVTHASDRHEAETRMRAFVKAAMRGLVESVVDIIAAGRQATVDQLAEKCRGMELAERASLAEAGIDGDLYAPSAVLIRLRETHRRALSELRQSPNRTDFRRLLEACGLAKPASATTE